MRIRRRNWILKRIVLGFAVAALVVPAAANARLSAGGAQEQTAPTAKIGKGDFMPFATDFPSYAQRSSVTLGTYGLPHAGYNDYLATTSAKIGSGDVAPFITDSRSGVQVGTGPL